MILSSLGPLRNDKNAETGYKDLESCLGVRHKV